MLVGDVEFGPGVGCDGVVRSPCLVWVSARRCVDVNVFNRFAKVTRIPAFPCASGIGDTDGHRVYLDN